MAVKLISIQEGHEARISVYEADVDFGSIGATTTGTVDVTIGELDVNDRILSAQPVAAMEDDILPKGALIPAANTVRFLAYNPTGGAINPASVVWTVEILRKKGIFNTR